MQTSVAHVSIMAARISDPLPRRSSMVRNRPLVAVAIPVVAAVAALAAGCGGSRNGGSAAVPIHPKAATGQQATVGLASVGGLGKVLVDSTGRTVYLFQKDARDESACTGACAAAWPPLLAAGKPVVGRGAMASLVGTITRSNDKPQVTYAGHPLYLFDGDSAQGDINGQGVNAFGARWYTVASSGTPVTAQVSGSSNGY
jgi:predicted lipoprotein with Yx(FWY)xxD motif